MAKLAKSSSKHSSGKWGGLIAALVIIVVILVVIKMVAAAFFFIALGIAAIVFGVIAWQTWKAQQDPVNLPTKVPGTVTVSFGKDI